MDPAAIQELQRLYSKKYAVVTERPSKRRRLQTSVRSVTSSDEDKSASSLEDSMNEIVQETTEERPQDLDINGGLLRKSHDAPDLVEVVSFDERTIVDPESGAVKGYKSFMSGKVPRTGQSIRPQNSKLDKDVDESSEDSEDDLRKDKELQKLLRESHLLHAQGGNSLETTGKTRHKAIAAQLLSNGGPKEKQRKMPIGMRKGIEAAGAKRLEATEKYNRENGIVTARKNATVIKKKSNKTLHELNVGKYKNGKLTISRREIDRINGPKQPAKGKKKRGFRDFSNIG